MAIIKRLLYATLKLLIYSAAVLVLLIISILIFTYRSDIPVQKLESKYFTPESKYVQVSDAHLHIRIRGRGEAVILLHGSFASLHTWQVWESELSKKFQTISVDFPGHGLSGPNKSETYHTDYYADLIFALADSLNIEAFHVVGSSMGGQVAWKMTLAHPERIKSLTLIDAAGMYQKVQKANQSNTKRPLIFTILTNRQITKFLSRFTPRFLFKINLRQVYANENRISDAMIDTYYELMLREGNRDATLKRFQQSGNNLTDRIKNIKTPTLIIWGEKDSWIPVAHAIKFHEEIPNSELVIFKDAGHVPMEEIPYPTVAKYLDFLIRLTQD